MTRTFPGSSSTYWSRPTSEIEFELRIALASVALTVLMLCLGIVHGEVLITAILGLAIAGAVLSSPSWLILARASTGEEERQRMLASVAA